MPCRCGRERQNLQTYITDEQTPDAFPLPLLSSSELRCMKYLDKYKNKPGMK
jgi:hypothetical protein